MENQLKEFARFLALLALMLLPALAFYAGLEWLAWKTGESMPIEKVARWQQQGTDRQWRGGDGRSYVPYKLARLKLLKPEVLVLGASRANSFRKEDFAPYSFYNAANCGWTWSNYIRFLQIAMVDGYAPKVMIFSMDYWMFSADYDKYWDGRLYETPETHWAALKMVWDHTFASIDWPWSPNLKPAVFPGQPDPNQKVWNKLDQTDRFKGLFAVLTGNGIHPDGSLLDIRDLKPDEKRLEVDGIVVGVAPPEGGDMAQNQIAAFEQFAAMAKAKNIQLIGVQVPLAGRIIKGLNHYPDNGMWREVRSEARRRYFEQKGVIFVDWADIPELRDHSERFLDSVHPDVPMITEVARRLRADPRVQDAFRKANLTVPGK